ncbi:MAG: ATP-dependent DNA helicase RecQ [Eggerthellaceae bacterium]|nr:ATP-dependent DNA helicase RecQ [Eggerthellaceae bacterium]
MATMDEARRVLAERFGYDGFRPGQGELVEAVLAGRDVLGVMPTGAGKSLCYQVPGVAAEGLALVVSPLVSLMGDQVRALLEAGVRGAYLNSTLTPGQQSTVMRRALEGAYDLMYVAPERLADPRFVDFASRARLSIVAVDEAHCVSQWGQDFRPSYLAVGDFIASLPERPPVCALTATATGRVRDDIERLLGLRDPLVLVTGFDRPNLRFSVERLEPKRKLARIAARALRDPAESGIVYCSTRKDVEKVHEALVAAGVPATRYHAGLSKDEREANQRAFIDDDAPVMVATNAFGMGIDKSNVRYVIHHNMPGSMEAYYQEAGRAGRDGEPSECLLFWSDGDISTCRFFIEQESGNEELSPEEAEAVRATRRRMLEAMVGYCYTTDCLRSYILRYFGEEPPGACGACGNCDGGFEAVDVTAEARAVMRCVHELRGRFGKGVVADVLRGGEGGRAAELGLLSARCFGDLGPGSPEGPEPGAPRRRDAVPAARIREVVELLAAGGYLVVTEGTYPTVQLGPRFREAAEPGFSLAMKRALRKPARAERPPSRAFGASGGASFGDEGLFEHLRALRKDIATRLGKPPYVVFSDATLRDMCARRPATDEEFLEVSGVGLSKLKRYGEDFMAAIRDYEAR